MANIVHEIANKVDCLILNARIRKHFVDNITRLCKMAEEYGNHVRQCWNDRKLEIDNTPNEKATKLQVEKERLGEELYAAILKEDQQAIEQIGKEQDSVTEEYEKIRGKKMPVPGCTLLVYLDGEVWKYFKLNDSGKVKYRSPHWVIPGPAYPLPWFGIIQDLYQKTKPTADEIFLCDCFTLAAIHDEVFRDPTKRLSYSQELILEQCPCEHFKRDEFARAVYDYYSNFYSKSGKRIADVEIDNRIEHLEKVFGRVQEKLTSKSATPGSGAANEIQGGAGHKKTANKRKKTKVKTDIPPIDTMQSGWNWNCKNLRRLKDIDSNPKRTGVKGTENLLKHLKKYLKNEKRRRSDIAETLKMNETKDRIITTMEYKTMFLQ